MLRCTCRASEDARRLQAICGLDERERAITLADIKLYNNRPGTLQMVNATRRFIANPVGFMTFYGESGNAKTLALMAAVNLAVAAGQVAVYTTMSRLLDYIRAAYKRTDHGVQVVSDSDYERLVRLCNVRVLAIDEFDKVKESEWTLQIETDLIDTRYRLGESGKAGTLIAMNDGLNDLPTWILSRLRQWPVIENNDPDLRPLIRKSQ